MKLVILYLTIDEGNQLCGWIYFFIFAVLFQRSNLLLLVFNI